MKADEHQDVFEEDSEDEDDLAEGKDEEELGI